MLGAVNKVLFFGNLFGIVYAFQARTSFKDCPARTVFDVVHDTEYRRKWDHDMIDMKEVCKVCVNNTVSYYAGTVCNTHAWFMFTNV